MCRGRPTTGKKLNKGMILAVGQAVVRAGDTDVCETERPRQVPFVPVWGIPENAVRAIIVS